MEISTGFAGEKPDKGLDLDGFPPVGARLEPGVSWLYAYTHSETLQTNFVKYEGGEQIAYVDSVSLNGSWSCVSRLILDNQFFYFNPLFEYNAVCSVLSHRCMHVKVNCLA